MNNLMPTSPEKLQDLLLKCALAVVNGQLTAKDANAVSGLASEIHKSIKLEYVSRIIESRGDAMCDDRIIQVVGHAK